MKTVFVLIGSLAIAGVLCANPVRYPRRAVGGQPVDLTPLMVWWQHRVGERPLSGWVHVTGRIVETNAYGWTIAGSVDDASAKPGKARTSHSKFILKTPPTWEMLAFYQLDGKLKQLTTERDQLNREIKSDAQRTKKLDQPHPRRTLRARIRAARNANRQLNQVQFDERNAHSRLDEVEKEIKQVEQQRSELSSGDRYTVDCFALKLNLQIGKLPIYDHGVVRR